MFLGQVRHFSVTPSVTRPPASQSPKLAVAETKVAELKAELANEGTERAAESQRAVNRSLLPSIAPLNYVVDVQPRPLSLGR